MSFDKSERPKTYEQLRSEASNKWHANAMIRERQQQEIMAAILESPDVKFAPGPDDIYSARGIVCAGHVCNGTTFQVQQWACCNGKVERAMLRCRTCGKCSCWDFHHSQWIIDSNATPTASSN